MVLTSSHLITTLCSSINKIFKQNITMTEKNTLASLPFKFNTSIILILLLVVAAFAIGSLYTKVQYLEKGASLAGTDTTGGNKQAQQPSQQIDAPVVSLAQVTDVFNKSAIKFGDDKKKVIFVEAFDPSCPYCAIASGQNSEINNQVGDKFKLVKDGGTYQAPTEEMRKLVDSGKASYAIIYRNGHGNGEMAMKALYCANDIGKFWQAHDLLMSSAGYKLINEVVKNDKSKSADISQFLSTALDQNKLKSCLDSGKYDTRLSEDTKLGDALGVQGTPGFFVNDKMYAGAYSFADMKSVVDGYLK